MMAEPRGTFLADFGEQVRRAPDRTAVSDDVRSFTYRELDDRADRLAGHLRRRGVGAESLVALYLENSVNTLVAILGVTKAGGAWVPLDFEWPDNRVRDILKNARPALVIAENSGSTHIERLGFTVIGAEPDELDESVVEVAGEKSPVCGDSLAYVIYTSGSTGVPKGVAVSHRGLRNYVTWAQRFYRVSQETTGLVHSSPSFDLTITPLLVPLLAGGEVKFASVVGLKGLLRGAAALRSGLLKITPAHLALLDDTARNAIPARNIDALVIGGEALWENTYAPWREHLPDAIRVNEYGPTETVVGCCAYLESGTGGRSAIPIGMPIDNTQVHILDSDMNRVGTGVVGEIFVGGHGVARGYWGQPGLTASWFIPDAFGAPGDRLYRTGDLARYLPGGDIEYVGRNDSQVKVNGFRVELGEIEYWLNAHEEVASCAVTAEKDAGETRIRAYVVLGGTPQSDSTGLREYLREHLPSYMVPVVVTLLEAMPLTENGKIDRRRLPDCAELLAEPKVSSLPSLSVNADAGSRDDVEFVLSCIFSELLNVPSVERDVSFFDLGGHSFLAVQLIARVEKEFGVSMPLSVLFEEAEDGGGEPSVTFLAKRLRQAGSPESPSPIVTLRRNGEHAPLYLIHPAGGELICYRTLVRGLPAGRPILGIRADESSLADGACDIAKTAAHYRDFIRTVQPDGAYSLVGWSMGGVLAFEIARQLWSDGREVDHLVLIDSYLNAPAEHYGDENVVFAFIYGLVRNFGLDPALLADQRLSAPAHEGGVDHVRELLREVQAALGMDSGDDLLTRLQTYRAHVQAAQAYEPAGNVPRLTLIQAAEQPPGLRGAARHRWQEYVDSAIEHRVTPGDHFGVLEEPQVSALVRHLAAILGDVSDHT